MRYDQMSFGRHRFGVNVIESEHALVAPKDAISDDMRCMIDDLHRFGQVKPRPGAYSLPDGTMVVHPTVYAALSKRLARDAEELRNRMAMEALFGRRRT